VALQNPNSQIQNRKGIYQAFEADGQVSADERWRALALVDGGVRIDAEITRIAPFEEPRQESLTLELGPHLALHRLSIHAHDGQRESRIDLSPDQTRADVCWREGEHSHTREFAWNPDCEIDYNSPLFNTVTLWRSRLTAGESRDFQALYLHPVTFEPVWMRQVYSYIGTETHATRFGALMLAHYQMDFGGEGRYFSHFWCDEGGVVFDFKASGGSGFQLVAVNFPR
jgi:hypothetical protein